MKSRFEWAREELDLAWKRWDDEMGPVAKTSIGSVALLFSDRVRRGCVSTSEKEVDCLFSVLTYLERIVHFTLEDRRPEAHMYLVLLRYESVFLARESFEEAFSNIHDELVGRFARAIEKQKAWKGLRWRREGAALFETW